MHHAAEARTIDTRRGSRSGADSRRGVSAGGGHKEEEATGVVSHSAGGDGSGDKEGMELLREASRAADTLGHEMRQLAVAEAMARGIVLHGGGGGDEAPPDATGSDSDDDLQQPV